MRVNLTNYQAEEEASGNTYSVELRFILDPGESETSLSKQNIRAQEHNSGTQVTPGPTSVIPAPNSSFTGTFVGVSVDGADSGAFLNRIVWGAYGNEQVDGTEQRRCFRTVTLEYGPASPAVVSREPPGISQGIDPSNWYPEFERRTIKIARPHAKLWFLGNIEQSNIQQLPLTDHTSATLRATKAAAKGTLQPFINAAGQRLVGSPPVELIAYQDTFTEYALTYADDAVGLEDRQNVLNNEDIVVTTRVGTVDFARVRWPAGTAKLESQDVSMGVFRHNDNGVVTDIIYAIRTTTVLVCGQGWDYYALNHGMMEVIDDAGTDKFRNIHTDRGPVMRDVPLSDQATVLGPNDEKNYNVYGLKPVSFSGRLGTYTAGSPAQILVS